jgi:hypothetical protein
MTNQNQPANPAGTTPNPADNPQTPAEKQGENKPAVTDQK